MNTIFDSNDIDSFSFENDLVKEFNRSKFKPNETIIHIRLTTRKKDKYITSIENLPDECDIKTFIKELKKKLSCNGCIKKDDNKFVIQLAGDHRDFIEEFLVNEKIATDDCIKVHGF